MSLFIWTPPSNSWGWMALIIQTEDECVSLCFCPAGGADGSEVPPPQNVITKTLNTNYTLSWDWPPGAAGTHAVTFTTQYVPNVISSLSRLAALGPPSNVTLAPAGSDLDVVVTDPLTSNNTSMREHVPNLYYHVQYWERQADGQASPHKQLRINTTMVTLPGLKAWTWYCVSVQSRDDFYSKTSDFTVPHCMQTEGNAVTLTKLGALLPAAVTAQALALSHSLFRPLSLALFLALSPSLSP
ncbi:interferon alpha/beta receptor 1a-like, partial [Neolamprologus brichardi]|uniref:interferon alpha/beta receptor 1a-like n=1 Tax=Neolamprologus brichardi TaxID=32507 RepID=UPI0003EC3E77